jgi:hypothetical protein
LSSSSLALPVTLSSGLAVAQDYPRDYPRMPDPRDEGPRPPPPGEGYLWQPGHWDWDGHRYGWAHGRYIHRAHGWHEYVPGHWARRDSGWIWAPPYWR